MDLRGLVVDFVDAGGRLAIVENPSRLDWDRESLRDCGVDHLAGVSHEPRLDGVGSFSLQAE